MGELGLLLRTPVNRAQEGGGSKQLPEALVGGVLQHAAVEGKAQQEPARPGQVSACSSSREQKEWG